MKPTRRMRKTTLHAALLAAGVALTLASAPALAALPTITVQGVLGDELLPGTASLAYEAASWLGKSYSLQLTIDAQGAGAALVEDGIPLTHWVPNSVAYVFTVDGIVPFTGADTLYGELQTINNFTAPSDPFLPSGVVAGNSYDVYYVSASGMSLGCVDGSCDSSSDTHESLSISFAYFWDATQVDAITDNSLPDLLGGGPFFTGGSGDVYIEFGQWNEATGYVDAEALYGINSSVAVTAVPEADAWAMLAAALGLVGWRVRRRAAQPIGA